MVGVLEHNHSFALLLDPEKACLDQLAWDAQAHPDYLFVGGSTGGDTTEFVRALRARMEACGVAIPIILFPGGAEQFTPEADGILYLSLISGTNPQYLVGHQIRSARAIHSADILSIPTAYILIDGGVQTSTMRVTHTEPLAADDIDTIVDTCMAAELMGKKAIYLEAGSGAKTPIAPAIIRAVRAHTAVTLIVGGGIRSPQAMHAAHEAGADIVVVGNHFESHPEQLVPFCTRSSESPEERTNADDERYMSMALNEAHKALAMNEIPIGCVIVSQGQIIGRGHNLTETLADVTAHAEMQAITAATQTVGGKYLPDATLYVTVEPCPMCAGSIGWAQIRRVVYGAPDPKRGFQTYAPRVLHAKATVTSGILEAECKQLIQAFFKQKR